MTDQVVPMLDQAVRRSLAERVARIHEDPSSIATIFPASGREVGRHEVVRLRLVEALGEALADRPERVAEEVEALYRYGDSDERRAVLAGLHLLPLADEAVPLLHDALRTNDPRLVAAALGPYGARELDQHAWRQGVLKCLFMGIPLDVVHDLRDRADEALAAMASAFADERRAAGRPVPDDVDLLTANEGA